MLYQVEYMRVVVLLIAIKRVLQVSHGHVTRVRRASLWSKVGWVLALAKMKK